MYVELVIGSNWTFYIVQKSVCRRTRPFWILATSTELKSNNFLMVFASFRVQNCYFCSLLVYPIIISCYFHIHAVFTRHERTSLSTLPVHLPTHRKGWKADWISVKLQLMWNNLNCAYLPPSRKLISDQQKLVLVLVL